MSADPESRLRFEAATGFEQEPVCANEASIGSAKIPPAGTSVDIQVVLQPR